MTEFDKRGQLSLWGLVEALQRRFEDKGLEQGAVDAAVVLRVGKLLARESKNDQRALPTLILQPDPA